MQEALLPHNFAHTFYTNHQNIRQGFKSVADYTTVFHIFVTRNDLAETQEYLTFRYIGGLRTSIQD